MGAREFFGISALSTNKTSRIVGEATVEPTE